MRKLVASLTASAIALGGCSSFAGGTVPQVAGSQHISSATRSPGVSAVSRRRVRVALHIEQTRRHKGSRRAHYLPKTARSISFSVNGGLAEYTNLPASTIYIDAPVGTDTFAISAYDEKNGMGNAIAAANVTKRIVLGEANDVKATLNGVVASIAVSLSNPSPNAGVPASVDVIATALDADGNVIVGSTSDYSTPIKLSISDSSKSGTLSLSKNVLQGPWAKATLAYNGGTLASGLPGAPTATVVATATGVASTSVAFTPTPTFYQFSIPTSTNKPQWIAAGADGNVWFTESPGNSVARITPSGVVTQFAVPTAGANPQQIIGASDGNLWFTEFNANKIARMTTTGTFTEFTTLFAPPPSDNPFGLVDRLDGTIWYVANGSSRVGFQGINSGTAGETSIPTANSGPFSIATAPDNNLYYTESNVDKIGRVTNLFTAQSEISLTAGSVPEQIVRGPDGNDWFTENGTSKIARLSPNSFSITGEFPTSTPNAAPVGITVGKDGALWFTENGLDAIGRITTGGTVSEFKSPVTGLGIKGITMAADGSLWVAEPGIGPNPGRIGRLVY